MSWQYSHSSVAKHALKKMPGRIISSRQENATKDFRRSSVCLLYCSGQKLLFYRKLYLSFALMIAVGHRARKRQEAGQSSFRYSSDVTSHRWCVSLKDTIYGVSFMENIYGMMGAVYGWGDYDDSVQYGGDCLCLASMNRGGGEEYAVINCPKRCNDERSIWFSMQPLLISCLLILFHSLRWETEDENCIAIRQHRFLLLCCPVALHMEWLYIELS